MTSTVFRADVVSDAEAIAKAAADKEAAIAKIYNDLAENTLLRRSLARSAAYGQSLGKPISAAQPMTYDAPEATTPPPLTPAQKDDILTEQTRLINTRAGYGQSLGTPIGHTQSILDTPTEPDVADVRPMFLPPPPDELTARRNRRAA